jgi:hypothetical protein
VKNRLIISSGVFLFWNCSNENPPNLSVEDKRDIYEAYMYDVDMFDYSGVRPEIRDSLTRSIDRDYMPDWTFGPFDHGHNKQYLWTLENVTSEECKILLDHPWVNMRAFAIEGLYWNQDPSFAKIFIEAFSDDSTVVNKHAGCLVHNYSLFDHCVSCLPTAESFYKDTLRFTLNQKIILDSLIMKTSDSLHFAEAKERLNWKP